MCDILGRKGRRRESLVLSKRRDIFALISTNPGIHLRGLKRKSQIELGALRNLLSPLVSKGLVVEESVEGRNSYFVQGVFSPDGRKSLSLLRKHSLRELIEFFSIQTIPVTRNFILEEFGMARTTLNGRLNKLMSEELLIHLPLEGFRITEKGESMVMYWRPNIIERMVDAALEIFDERY